MLKKYIKKYIPAHHEVREHKYLKWFGPLLASPHLFHLNRRSVSGAFTVGLFSCYIPIPFQMILAAALAIFFNVNVPLSVALVWITNPLTMPIMFYGAYLTGALILGTPSREFTFELSWDWLSTELAFIWQPFLLGCFINAIIAAILGNLFIRSVWRYLVVKSWELRQLRRKKLVD